ncbi:MAG TPA: MFS transporter [Micropepsaceae bacterium]|jgi:AAHS family 4-hydroxybenzoate transporter-like MFS transporter|nr:MFS transporter [Micropepsaceae bacterium]
MAETIVKITELIDRPALGPFQKRVALLCASIVFVEGFNTQAAGYVAPALARNLHLTPAGLGEFFAAGLFGLLLGAMFVAPLADRVGRRPLLLGCVPFLALCAIATAFSTSALMLDGARFLTGLGIGGAMPNAIALTSEYSPHHRRSLLVALMFTGFVLGAVAVGLVSTFLVPVLGWQSIFIIGGVLGLLLTPVLFYALPESIRFLVVRGTSNRTVAGLVRRLDPNLTDAPDMRFVIDETPHAAISVLALFRDGRAKRTILLWIIYFMSLLDLFLLASWLPTEMQALGVSAGLAIIIGALLQFGGVFGLVFGWLADRLGASSSLGLAFFMGAACVAGIGLAGANLPLVMLAVFGTGVGLIGGQSVTNATAAIAYPTEIRSTGVGWATGIGRIGSIIGPSLAAWMHTMNVAIETIFLLAAIPALCAAVAGAALGPVRTAIITRAAPAVP